MKRISDVLGGNIDSMKERTFDYMVRNGADPVDIVTFENACGNGDIYDVCYDVLKKMQCFD